MAFPLWMRLLMASGGPAAANRPRRVIPQM
jgi:hypothetical protein